MSGTPGRSRLRRSAAKPRTERIVVMIDSATASSWRRVGRNVAARVRAAARAALAACPPVRAGEVTVRLSGDAAVRRLNHDFRGKDKPTNVLSFPMAEGDGPDGTPAPLGDIVIAYGTVAREAASQGKTIEQHLLHLVVHGVLHLLGYDHERPADARRMESLETRILASFGIADPYVMERRA